MVVVEIDTGFVGGTHEVETGLTIDDFNSLSDKEKTETLEECVWEKIQAHFKDEGTGEIVE